ncbi:MAG: glutaredoxin family protein [Mariprofundaceae bacterium]
MNPPALELMSRKACCLCEDAELLLADFVAQGRCNLKVLDVDQDLALAARYGMDVPVLLVDQQVKLQHRITREDLENLLLEKHAC